jgi:hypothetical protein
MTTRAPSLFGSAFISASLARDRVPPIGGEHGGNCVLITVPDPGASRGWNVAIEKRDVKRKELVIEPLPDGGTRTRELSGEESTQRVLSDEEVREVAKLGIRDEDHYRAPPLDPGGEHLPPPTSGPRARRTHRRQRASLAQPPC